MTALYRKTKRCSKCGEIKSLENFYERAGFRDGFTVRCKECLREERKQYYRRTDEREKARLYWKEHKEENRERCNAYRKKHKEKYLKWTRENRRKITVEVLLKYGGKCRLCGDQRLWALTLAHMNDDGAKHRRELGRNGIASWLKMRGFPKDLGIGVECYTCNLSAGKNSWRRVERDKWLEGNR